MPGQPQAHVPLAPLTTWKIGGRAEWFWQPRSEAELLDALAWARHEGLKVHLLGRGSNVLIADAGLDGLVICLRELGENAFHTQAADDGSVCLEVPGGMSLPRLSKVAAQHGYSGYEFFIGIPGTVGGAVVMNAGYGPCDPRQTAALCSEVRVLSPDGGAAWRPYTDFHPAYRKTDLMHSHWIVTAARFRLFDRAAPEAIRAETALHLQMRHQRQPLTRPTAGSVFKATEDGVPAAVLIDRCGLKGACVGGAQISYKHANWIENIGQATAADVLALIEKVVAVVDEREGIRLQPEIRLLS